MNKKYPWKHAIITGLIVGIFAIGSFAIVDYLNKHFGWGINTMTIRGLTGLLTLIILGIGIYSGIQNIKRNNGGIITYKHAITSGFIIALITGVITALVSFVYCNYLNPGYTGYMLAESKKVMIADGKSAAEISAGMQALQREWTTSAQMFEALVGQTVCGTVISLIMGLLMKTKK